MDANFRVIGEGLAGRSNSLRVGIAGAATAVREAIASACAMAKLRHNDLVAAQVGLAGARRRELRERMRETLTRLDMGELEVVTDADIALYGATDGAPGLVVIAGTGSDRKSTRLNSSHLVISYAVFCLKKKMFKPIFVISKEVRW